MRRALLVVALGCGGNGDRANDGGPPSDDAEPRDAARPPAELGDLLTYTFDDEGSIVVRDRSGRGHHGFSDDSRPVAGRYGLGRAFAEDGIVMADYPTLFAGDHLTVEAWLRRDPADDGGAILSDAIFPAGGTAGEASFEVGEAGLVFWTTDCDRGPLRVESGVPVPRDQWIHVALTWDGATAAFFHDAVEVARAPLAARVCPVAQPYGVGRYPPNEIHHLTGVLDEIKLSSYPRTVAELAASMAHDSAGLAVCGDGGVEGDEACDRAAECCAACRFAADGTACGDGATCAGGRCASGAGGRVTRGLIQLHDFEALDGGQIADRSGVAPLAPLTASASGVVDRTADGYVELALGQLTGDASKLNARASASGEVTLEAWLRPDRLPDDNPRQIVTVSSGPTARNLALAQLRGRWVARLRSTGGDARGDPPIGSGAGDAALGQLAHVVYTRASDGAERLYVDGALREIGVAPGELTGWDPDHPLSIGGDVGGGNPWRGAIHLLAFYEVSLTASEVARNTAAGPDPSR